jgi:hypothetical protein
MHKDEILQLHSMLCQMKRYFEAAGLPLTSEFAEYDAFGVLPQHLHRSKTDHRQAMMLLSKGLSEIVCADSPDHQAHLRKHFLDLATHIASEGEEAEEVREQEAIAAKRDEGLPAFALSALHRHEQQVAAPATTGK